MFAKKSFLPLLMTLFNDALNYGIVLVIFAPMLVGEHPRFLLDYSVSVRTIILGFLFAASPLGQFLSSPFIGALSDSLGRKKVLLITLWGTCIFSILSAFAIHTQIITLLFCGRFLAGLMSGNATLAQAAVADLSDEKTKAKNLSVVGIVGGLAWIIGAPLGGILANPNIASWFNFSTPIWFLALMFLVNAILTHLFFKETYQASHSEFRSFAEEIRNIGTMFKNKSLQIPLVYLVFFYTGWFMYLSFFPTLLVHKFGFTETGIGFLSGWCSALFMAGSIWMSKSLSHRYSPDRLLFYPSLVSFAGVFISAIVPKFGYLIITFAFANFCGAIIWIATLSLVSNIAGKQNQGKVFGVQQAMLSLGTLIAPIISGFFAIFYTGLPLILGSGLLLMGGFIFRSCFRPQPS